MVLRPLVYLLAAATAASASSSWTSRGAARGPAHDAAAAPSSPPISMGTTIVAARWGNATHGGVVVGADSRTSAGGFVSNRLARKVTPIATSIVVARSGSAADTQNLADDVRQALLDYELEFGAPPPVLAAARLLAGRVYAGKDRLSCSLLCAGWDAAAGAQIYSIPQGGSLMAAEGGFALGGSGSTLIYGWCDSTWREGLEREECCDFVARALELACARDGSSGGLRHLTVIGGADGRIDRRVLAPGGDEAPAAKGEAAEAEGGPS